MTIDTQRWIDRFVGVPLCLVAALGGRLFGRRSAPSAVRSICVVKFFGIGSIVLTSPFLAELRTRFPDARITYLTFAHNAETLRFYSFIDDILTISTDSWLSFLRDTLRVILRLRTSHTDTVFDLEFFSKFSTLLGVMSGAERRIGFSLPTRWRSWNLTGSVSLDRTDHVAVMFMRQLKALGDVPDRPLTLPPIAPAEDERMSLREKSGLMQNGHAIVVVNANADDTSFERRWHPDRFAEVIDAIARARPDAAFYLTGTASERRYVEGIARQCRTAKTVRNVAGDLSLGEFVALLEISSVVLTNDSGPVHLAAAMGTPVVGLYGPESPQFYGPLDGSVAFYAGLECSPCLNVYTAKKFVCPYNARCMDAINVPDVTSAVLKVLNHKVVHALVD